MGSGTPFLHSRSYARGQSISYIAMNFSVVSGSFSATFSVNRNYVKNYVIIGDSEAEITALFLCHTLA